MAPLNWERFVPSWLATSGLQGILIVDTTLTVRFWSRWLAQTSGRAADDAVGQLLTALFPDLDERGITTVFMAALSGEERILMQREYGYVFPLPPADGTDDFAWMQQRVRIGPIHADEAIVGAFALIDDMTERARKERVAEQLFNEQQETLALLQTLLINAPIGFAFVDRNLRFRHVNERLARLNRLPAAEHIGRTYAELFPQTAELIMPLFEHVLQSGEPLINHEISAFDPETNSPMHFLVNQYPIQRSDGALFGVGALVLETTDRKRIEAATRLLEQFGALISEPLTAEEMLQAVAQLTIPILGDCCLIEFRADNQPPHYISASTQHTGACRDLMHLLQTAHGQPVLISNLAQRNGISASITPDLPIDDLRAHGLRGVLALPLRARGRPIGAIACASTWAYNADDFGLAAELGRRLAQALDSFQLYQAEQRARASAEQAVQVRDEFFSIAAHELRTPLTTMLGRIQLLERRMRRAASDERDLRAVETIHDQAQRLNRMISALLNVSQIEMGQLHIDRQPLNLRDLARRIVDEHRLTLEQHTVTFIAPDDPVAIRGDAMRLEQVLQNLLSNAAKYSPNGGQITVALTSTNQIARLAVIDCGIGIPADELPRLFRRFYRAAHKEGQRVAGMGIGLYVVREVIERHGGRVTVESVEGRGSTFAIELPLLAGPSNP